MTRIALVLMLAVGVAVSAASRNSIPEPQFADPARAQKLAAAFPDIERIFTAWVERLHAPGAVVGVIIDGQLAFAKTAGVSNVAARTPVTAATVFRIASMTKSFTATAILKLRDEGKLSLDDPVARYVPELSGLAYPTADSPVLTIRHLLTHSEGFPEDNPWGDRQLARSEDTMSAWMRNGIPFSTVPGTAYEYSNYGFAILGQIVERVSKQPYDQYVTTNVLVPLGMRDTTFEVSRVPSERVAHGYRFDAGAWTEEQPLPHGTFGAMGGLWTTVGDLAKYVAFQMSAWPPRDAPETGPIKRSSAREMQQVWRFSGARATRRIVDAPLQLSAGGYGYGLRISQNCSFRHIVSHGGGLPGYGSFEVWLPDYGVGMIGMGNVTYAGLSGMIDEAFAALSRTGALKPRVVQPAAALVQAKADVSRLITSWDDALANRIAADNLFLDQPADRRAARFRELASIHGACAPEPGIEAENALRGTWKMKCERGRLDVAITLAPTEPPTVQYLGVQSVMPPGAQMTSAIDRVVQLTSKWADAVADALAGPGLDLARVKRQVVDAGALYGACRAGDATSGDGVHDSAVRLSCERGDLVARLSLDDSGKLKALTLAAAGDSVCAP